LSLGRFTPEGNQVNRLVNEIVVDQFARQMHSFSARNYRDRFALSLNQSVVEATDQVNANLRFGLAFRAEPVLGGRRSLRSRVSCTQLLNAVVESLEKQLHEVLSVLDRRDVLQHAIRNYETATFRKDRWEKTAQANISLHPDDPDAAEVIARQTGRLNSAITGSRLLLEIAGTMCTVLNGRQIGQIEFQEVLSLIDSVQILRGWADSIHRGAMPPVLKITPLGDILADTTFQDEVMHCFHLYASKMSVEEGAANVVQNYKKPEPIFRDAPNLNSFEAALLSEVGIGIDEISLFLEALEDLGVKEDSLFYEIDRKSLLNFLDSYHSRDTAESVLDAFTLPSRADWSSIPNCFRGRDLELWQTRRMLSAVRRPIIDIGCGSELLISPSMVRESVAHVIHAYFEGHYFDEDLKSKPMRQWKSKRANERGTKFATLVRDRLEELGWQTWLELEFTELFELGPGHVDRRFLKQLGDVDVLAFDPNARRLLAIECKDLYYNKTHWEVAGQLLDYRGETKPNGKPDDLLKHLNRMEFMRVHLEFASRFVGTQISARLEPWIIFRHPTPMLFQPNHFQGKTSVGYFDDFGKHFSLNFIESTWSDDSQ